MTVPDQLHLGVLLKYSWMQGKKKSLFFRWRDPNQPPLHSIEDLKLLPVHTAGKVQRCQAYRHETLTTVPLKGIANETRLRVFTLLKPI